MDGNDLQPKSPAICLITQNYGSMYPVGQYVFLGFLGFFDKGSSHVSVIYTRVILVDTKVMKGFNLLPWGDVKHIFDIVSYNKLAFLGI